MPMPLSCDGANSALLRQTSWTACSVTRFDLRLGDCVAGMARLAKLRSIDLVVTSPPYNLGIRYGKFSDTADRASYLDWCEEWAAQIRRLLQPNGSLFLNIGAAPSNPMLPHELILRLRKFFVLQNTIHWIKAITIPDDAGEEISRGHFKPISSPRFLNDCHEYVFHLTPDGKNAARSPRARCALRRQIEHRALEPHPRARPALPRQHLVRSLRDDSAAARKSGRIRRLFRCSWR